jgi:hypothetical protein
MPAFGSKDTYRWEGAVLGGVLGALMFGYMGLRVCYSDCVPSTAAIALTGGVLGGFTGMMIGGLFSKQPPVRDQDGEGDE